MTHTHRDTDALLEQAAAQIREARPGDAVAREAASRVWSRLSSDAAAAAAKAAEVDHIDSCADYQALIPAYLAGALPEARKLLVEDHSRECVPCRRALKTAREGKPLALPRTAARRAGVVPFPYLRWGLAAAAVLAGLLMVPALLDVLGPAGPSATVATVDGDLFRVAETSHLPIAEGDVIAEGERVRTGRDGGAVIALRDGSLVELRARSEVSIDDSRKGTTIELERGSVIVQAAEQRQRHLYVSTHDCLVSVTGTIFAVDHGTKGSRVAVIEGQVRVNYSGDEELLEPGDQLATNPYLARVPFETEIGWSRDLDQYLELVSEYTDLRRELQSSVSRPGLRTSSRLLDLVPEGTAFYAGLPNLGETISETHRVLRDRIAQSPALAEWWQSQGYEEFEPMADEIVARVGEFGDYLGQEIVLSGQLADGGESDDFAGPLVLAEIVDAAGFQAFVEEQLAAIAEDHGADVEAIFLDDPFAPVVGMPDDGFFMWLHSDLVVASPKIDPIRQVAGFVLEGEPNPFTESPFYDSLLALYADGVDILLAADLERVVALTTAGEEEGSKELAMFERTGLGKVKHLMAEQKRLADTTQHRLALTFTEARSGLASWLAEPAPMGALDFVSPEAKLVAAFVFKDPAKLLDDLSAITGEGDGLTDALALFEEKHGLDLRDDFAATLGGEFAFAIDGPLLPEPAWKLVIEVYDPARFQWTLEQALADVNDRLVQEGHEPLVLAQEESGGRTFYSLPLAVDELRYTIHYTFVEGYVVMAPSRPLLDRALRFRSSGYTLTEGSKFTALLPSDSRNNFSGVIYQDLSGVLQSVAERIGKGGVTAEQQQLIDELRGEARPTLGYAYGEPDRIILAASTHGDAMSGLVLRLLGLQDPLGFEKVWQSALEGGL